jgi:hypothetical protein
MSIFTSRAGGALALVAAALMGNAAPANPAYTTIDPPGSVNTLAMSINNTGDIAGYYEDSSSNTHGFLRDFGSGTYTVFDGPSSLETVAKSISGAQITGYYVIGNDVHGFLRKANGSIVTFDPAGSIGTTSLSIANGWIAGYFTDSFIGNHYSGFVRDAGGTITNFDVAGATDTTAVSVNMSGAAAGSYADAGGTHGFLRAVGGTITPFDVPGTTYTAVVAIMNNGKIVGYKGFNGERVFIRRVNGTFQLFHIPGAGQIYPTAANNNWIAGYTYHAQTLHGFVRDPSGAAVTFDPPGSVRTTSAGVNSSGMVVGQWRDGSGVPHGFLRTP